MPVPIATFMIMTTAIATAIVILIIVIMIIVHCTSEVYGMITNF